MGKLKDDLAELVDRHCDKNQLAARLAETLRDVVGIPDANTFLVTVTGDAVALTVPDGTETVTDRFDLPRLRSGVPLDRREVVEWIESKARKADSEGKLEHGHILIALRDELAQHIEERPIDMEKALREWFADVHGRNVKAGWWRDLATGLPLKRSVGELFMLFVTEITEAYDAWYENQPDDKLPDYPGLGVALADLGIRWADFCGALAEGKIVFYSGALNPGEQMFHEVCGIARRYEAIRKTDAAKGDPELGEFMPAADVAEMITAKLAFNAIRPDHKEENRILEGGKKT